MPLPFQPPAVSAAAPHLGPELVALGADACERVEAALARELGVAVRLRGREGASRPAPASGVARTPLPLGALGEVAALEIDAGFVSRVLGQLSGARSPSPAAALCPTPGERAFLTLAALTAVDALLPLPGIAGLAPRVGVETCAAETGSAFAVELELALGALRGRGRLLLPLRATAALAGAARDAGARTSPEPAAAALRIPASLRQLQVALAREELAALTAGDVLLLDEGEEGGGTLVLPGGLTLCGALEGDAFTVEAITMSDASGSYPLTVEVEVARVTVALGELARLAPGSVLALGTGLSGAAVLRAGERALARGELVELEGALGFRVVELGGVP